MMQLNGTGPVILVDDDEVDLELLATFYRQSTLHGRFELSTFRAGPVFLDHMSDVENGAAPMPSIVLLDINMPAMSGFEVLERLRSKERFSDLPAVMFLSNSDSPRDVERCQTLGAGFQEKFDRAAACIAFFDSLAPADDTAPDGGSRTPS